MLPLVLPESALPVQLLRGLYLGLLTGIIPALVALSMGFLFRYVTGVSIPAFAVVSLSVAVAGANGGLLALVDPTVAASADAPTLTTALLVVMLLSLYAHNRGDKLGAEFPRRLSLRGLRGRSLAGDVVEGVAGFRRVRVRVVGPVSDVAGAPPLPEDVRTAIRDGEWTFPADLPLAELERRLADRLRTEFDLAEVEVRIDDRARATVAAAPPLSGLSRRLPAGKRAVSVDALLPTGIARGDEVTVLTADAAVDGTVVSARTDGAAATEPVAAGGADESPADAVAANGAGAAGAGADEPGTAPASPAAQPVQATTGGEGRITVAVGREDARALLRADAGRVVVAARGTGGEHELVSLLRRAGQRVEHLTVRAGGPLDGVTIGAAGVRDAHGVVVLAVRHDGAWQLGPRGETRVAAGDELYAAGPRDAVAGFREAVA